jgi:hypothetical protein
LTSGVDGAVCVWDVMATARPLFRVNYGTGTSTQVAQFNPRFFSYFF